RKAAGTDAMSFAGLPAGFIDVGATAAAYDVTSDVVTLLLFTHCTTEHARKVVGELASISHVKHELAASAVGGLGDGGTGGIAFGFPANNARTGDARFPVA